MNALFWNDLITHQNESLNKRIEYNWADVAASMRLISTKACLEVKNKISCIRIQWFLEACGNILGLKNTNDDYVILKFKQYIIIIDYWNFKTIIHMSITYSALSNNAGSQ